MQITNLLTVALKAFEKVVQLASMFLPCKYFPCLQALKTLNSILHDMPQEERRRLPLLEGPSRLM